jgi:hypothetical protein
MSDMVNPNYGFIYETQEVVYGPTRSYPSVNAGLIYYFKFLQVGFAANYLTQPRQSFTSTWRKPAIYNSYFSGFIPIKKWLLNPYLTMDFLTLKEESQMKTTLLTGGLMAFAPKIIYGGIAFSNLSYSRISLGLISFQRLRIGVDADLFLNKNTATYFGPVKTLQMHIRYVSEK